MGDYQITPAQTLQAERLRFPGMLPAEILIWRNWLRGHEIEFDRYDYNVRIGAGTDPGPTWADNIRQMAIANSQLRLDVVAYKSEAPVLIEVKRRAGASAIGQLVTYEAVWLKDFPATPPLGLILVTDRLQPNILPIVQKANIRLDLVPTDYTELAFRRPLSLAR